jgi:hypothetical protein
MRQLSRSAACRVALGALCLGCVSTAISDEVAGAENAALPPGYSLSHTGDIHDFDYFIGGWVTKQRRLKTTGVGSSEWEAFPAMDCLTSYLDKGQGGSDFRSRGAPLYGVLLLPTGSASLIATC